MEKFIDIIANELNLDRKGVTNTINLLKDGATIPFISRYRKEATGGFDEVDVAEINNEYTRLETLKKRKETILKSIEEQGKLTDSLRRRIDLTWDSLTLEDIYLPYKRKRKTRASIAIEKGLEPLAKSLYNNQEEEDVDSIAATFINKDVPDEIAAILGARDIIAEWISEDEKVRNKLRYLYKKEAVVYTKVVESKKKEAEKYKDYFDFSEPLKDSPSHRVLAMRRGENEGFLRMRVKPEEDEAMAIIKDLVVNGRGQAGWEVEEAAKDSYKRLLAPSIEAEFRKSSKEKADEEAIGVFADNLRQLLLSPPLGQKAVVGIDPGYRTGCKVVCLDASGKLLHNTAIYPHPPQSDTFMAKETIMDLVDRFDAEAIAVGNGTAGRETVAFCRDLDFGRRVEIFSVNESGASIYSASEIAREEFPDYDVTVRGAVSIGRRLMDPLAELVKIDAKSIGVGQYQHDVNQAALKQRLDREVESCVNAVGVNLNTASKHLLTYVSGLGPVLAQNIINYREENGTFNSRKALMKVPRMGAKAFEQCAGFLRVRDAKNPLDNTAVHPESYTIVEQMAKDARCSVQELIANPFVRKNINLRKYMTDKIGLPTLKDIMKELDKPGLDPRGEAQSFQFAQHIKTIGDLEVGMVVPGIVNNITNFGAFVDIGVKESGLVHISQLANRFVKKPTDVVQLQQKVMVKIMEVDLQRKRIQLSMKAVQ